MQHAFDEHLANNRYYDRHFQIDAAKILPGEYFVSNTGMLLVTVLGSCVAACIRDVDSGLGGMNHFMLPDDGRRDTVGTSARYGTYAMEILINHLLKLGARRNNLEAKIFGGGRVIRGFTVSNVGARNAEFVQHYLERERIPIVASDLEDIFPRKVYYFPHTGKVFVKKLKSVHNNTIVEREREYESRLRVAKVEGDVELF